MMKIESKLESVRKGKPKWATYLSLIAVLLFMGLLHYAVCVNNMPVKNTVWALTPALMAISLALITKEVYSSLFIGALTGAVLIADFEPVGVTDKHRISRAKLAYLIDSTAAPICIIAPISSWAAAVAGFVKGESGIHIFIQSIPFNFYAMLTLVMMAFIIFMKMDYGPMLLVTGCVIGMIYTGGFFQGKSFAEAFAASDASVGLVMGSSVALVTTIAYYLLRQSLSFADCMECLPEGFKQMVPAMLILTFAWTLKSMTDSLGAATYVASLVEHSAAGLMGFLPAIIFVVAVGLAFASGTSWGTFGILIPIVVSCLQEVDPQLMIISISACMAGAVCGDHCSPISDTTIMSSAGAQCDHINHVTTQLPYALTVASVSFFTFLLAGFIKNALLSLLFGIVALFLLLVFIRRRYSSRQSTVSCKHHK